MAEISAQVDLSTPSPTPRRQTAAQKARALIRESKDEAPELGPTQEQETKDSDQAKELEVSLARLTARVHSHQLAWVRDRVKEYRDKSVGPKLTNDELTRISLSLLQTAVEEEGGIVSFVNKYRAGEIS